jgi:hypothetical protein
MKRTMFLVVWQAIRCKDSEWARIYERLVPIKCRFNEKTRQYSGCLTVMGRIAGQIISVLFVLLKRDQEVLSKLSLGTKPPEPTLYDPEVHRQHRAGQYRAFHRSIPSNIIELPLN